MVNLPADQSVWMDRDLQVFVAIYVDDLIIVAF